MAATSCSIFYFFIFLYSQASLAKVVPEFAVEVIKATVTQYFEDAGKLTVRNKVNKTLPVSSIQ